MRNGLGVLIGTVAAYVLFLITHHPFLLTLTTFAGLVAGVVVVGILDFRRRVHMRPPVKIQPIGEIPNAAERYMAGEINLDQYEEEC